MTDNENKDITSEGAKAAAEKELDDFLSNSEKDDGEVNDSNALVDDDGISTETIDKSDEVFTENDNSSDVIWEEIEADSFADVEKLEKAESEFLEERNGKKHKTATAVLISLISIIIITGLCFGIYTMLNSEEEDTGKAETEATDETKETEGKEVKETTASEQAEEQEEPEEESEEDEAIQSTGYPGNSSSAMIFAGEEIDAEDLKLFMIFSDNDYDTAVDMLTQYLVYSYAAKKHNVVLDESSRQEVQDYITGLKQSVSDYGYVMPNISDERLFEMFSIEFMASDVGEAITSDILYSDDEFATFMENYSEQIKLNSSIVNIKYILTETEKTANEAKKALDSGMEPNEAILSFSSDYADIESDNDGDESDENLEMEILIDNYPLQEFGFDEELTNQIMALEEGDYTDVIALTEDIYLVFIMDEKDVIDDSELQEIGRAEYEYNKKNNVLYERLEAYEIEADIQLNDRLVDTIRAETAS